MSVPDIAMDSINKLRKEKKILPHPVTGPKIDLLDVFKGKEGTYLGFGDNHDNMRFRGELILKQIVGGRGIGLDFTAVGMEGTEFNKSTTLYNEDTILFNQEYSIIAYDTENRLGLWVLSSTLPTMIKFELRRYREVSKTRHIFIFGFGDPENNAAFREEITLELSDADFSYNYSWGQSDGLFLARSSVTMKKII